MELDVSHEDEAQSSIVRSFRGVVRAMSKMVEQRDPYTAGHAEGVSRLASAIGRQMGFDDRAVEGLRISGLLHDIGKISVPAEILTKPTRLTPIEYEMVKQHSASGHEILKNIPFPWPVAEAALQHHERLDGSGYPQALKGEAIIVEARILAVADVVDAMTTHRPYRPGIGIGGAMAEIERGKESIYDPVVVEACMEVIAKIDRRVMVVDDEVLILQLLDEFLSMIGYEVLTFNSPVSALKSFEERPFPIVLTDLDMPEMNGLEFIARLRERAPDIQIMVLTGHGRKEDAVQALRLGVSDFVDKPVALADLKEAVEKAFQRAQKQKFLHLQAEDADS